MLRAVDLSFGYGRRPVVTRVGLDVAAGSVVGVLGPNGSGKTTLLRLLAGVLRPQSGRVLFDERDIATIPRRQLARRLAVVPQDTHFAFDYTAMDVALMGRFPHLGAFELESPDDEAIARRALEATGTLGLAERPFSTLSGGERQRVVIASALAQFDADAARGRQVLLLDEPTAALDLRYQVKLAELLARLNADRGLTIVVSTHDLAFAAGLCQHLVLLREGRVIAAGTTDSVLTAEHVEALYDVAVDVRYHEEARRLTVVPVRR